MKNLTLLIIEDEIELLNIYYQYATEVFSNVYLATSIEEAKKIIAAKRIDGIICDNYLPDGKGLTLIKELNSKRCSFPTIIITANPEYEYAIDAVNSYVFKFLVKPIQYQEFNQVLKHFMGIIRSNKIYHDMVTTRTIVSETLKTFRDDYRLTPRESEILELIMDDYSTMDMAKKLFISHLTVKKHIQHIFTKTGISSRKVLRDKISKSDSTLMDS